MRTLWPYVDDDHLVEQIRTVMNTMEGEIESLDIYRNALDPFSAMFEMAHQEISFDEWVEQEQIRQTQKTLQNAVGYFHQKLLGCVDGWRDAGTGGGYDLVNDDRKIIAEIKNKHNTMNSGAAGAVYRHMVAYLDDQCRGYTGYVVMVIPSRPQRVLTPYAPSDSGVSNPVRNDLLKIDGASFYEVVTGDRDALQKLYSCLPEAIRIATDRNDGMESSAGDFQALFVRTFGS